MYYLSYDEPAERGGPRQLRDYAHSNGIQRPRHLVRYNMDDSRSYDGQWQRPSPHYGKDPDDRRWPEVMEIERYQNTGAISEADDSEGNPKSMKRVCTRFAERTSMQGIPYINASKTWYAKMVWVTLSLVAIGVMIYHLYFLFTSFYSYQYQSKVTLGFKNLELPAITFCNINPIKQSKLFLGNKALKEYVRSIRPDMMITNMKNLPPPPKPPGPTGSPQGRKRRFIEDLSFNFTNTRSQLEDMFDHRKHASTKKSNFLEIRKEFNYLFSTLTRGKRTSMGHELEDFLVSCSFAGFVCNSSKIRIFATPTYGNCYTLEDHNLISYRSGPENGLELILFLETDEYIHTIASGIGAQIEIHAKDTLPNPEVNGMSVSAGMQTSVGMRLVQIERLDEPYSVCATGEAFRKKYGKVYTRQACIEFCLQEEFISKCNCFDVNKEEMTRNLNNLKKELSPCRTIKEMTCMMQVEADFESGKFSCTCPNPCLESTYQRLSSSLDWPNDEYAKILVQYLCNNLNETECTRFGKMDGRKLKNNFLKVNIFFEDLNYENITEVADYENAQFLSDVGGTIGLWIGLSVLSFAEVIQFFAELLHYICVVRPKQKMQRRRVRKNSRFNAEGASSHDKDPRPDDRFTPRAQPYF